MQLIDAEQIRRLPFELLIEGLRQGFRAVYNAPARSILSLDPLNGRDELFALMPAWDRSSLLGAKLATVFPGNAAQYRPNLHSLVVLFDRQTGTPTAVLDGTELTRRRTAAVSALAASYLARDDARRLLIVGTGPQAITQALAHCEVRPIESVAVWGRNADKAALALQALHPLLGGRQLSVARDLPQAARAADIISCATSSTRPILEGAFISAGTHVDLVGAFSPRARESDTALIRKSLVYADVTTNVLAEAGDVLIPIAEGAIDEHAIVGDLRALTDKAIPGRVSSTDITVFKSVGTAMADVVAASCVLTNRC
jgi:ornithine cyclodeaminase/alanine dehydrogenase-like protein (mu-crystallin family)